MDLSPRQRIILSKIIRSYIETGEPVSSKSLSHDLDFNLSTATLRNEMSELGALGLLTQPHTSAGRIPTNRGYRMFITDIIEGQTVGGELKNSIDSLLDKASQDPERLMSVAGIILSDITGLPAIVSSGLYEEAYVRRVEIMPMSRRMLMIVMITSEGIAKSRICRTNTELTPQMLSRFDRIITARIVGARINEFDTSLLQQVIYDAEDYAVAFTAVISSIFDMIDEMQSSKLSLKGEQNLISCYSRNEDARALIELVQQNRLLPIINNIEDPISIIFGDDTGLEELKPSNLVVAKYGHTRRGRIGVLGPTRMSYEQVIPGLRYFTAKLNKILEEAVLDMED